MNFIAFVIVSFSSEFLESIMTKHDTVCISFFYNGNEYNNRDRNILIEQK